MITIRLDDNVREIANGDNIKNVINEDMNRVHAINTMNYAISREIPDSQCSFSGVFAFKNSPPIRYRRLLRANAGTHPIASDPAFCYLLREWMRDGIGEAYMNIQARRNPTHREMYPYKADDGKYLFFNGRYGTGELWQRIREARRVRDSAPQIVYDTYINDPDGFSDMTMYDHPDDGSDVSQPRAHRIFLWDNGEIVSEHEELDGYSGNFARSSLSHRYLDMISDENGNSRWRMLRDSFRDRR